jgi:fatty acid desaturase
MRNILNATLLLLSLLATSACLWAASHLDMFYAGAAIFLFALVNNTPFALMHEAVHGIAATSPRLNALIGIVSGWMFPTSFAMQRIAHLGHHQRNRTDEELYDYYLPQQSRLVRNLWLYLGNLLGLYWWSVLFSNLLYCLCPWIWRSRFFVQTLAPALGFGPYVRDLAQIAPSRLWGEIALAFAWQTAIFYVFDLALIPTLLCYAAFALHWSVLQYADHAWSARDVRNGAWNLKVLPSSRWIALNYHYHRAHHQQPEIPWYALPAQVAPNERQPSFWRVYFSLWKGVRSAPPMGAPDDLAFLFPSSQEPPQ